MFTQRDSQFRVCYGGSCGQTTSVLVSSIDISHRCVVRGDEDGVAADETDGSIKSVWLIFF